MADALCLGAVFRRVYGGSHPRQEARHSISDQASSLATRGLRLLLDWCKRSAEALWVLTTVT